MALNPGYRYQARVTRVVDGDTFDADVDLGFHTHARLRFRLAGVDAPETYGVRKTSNEYQAGLIAKTYLEDRIGELRVIIESEKSGKYGRWLATVFIDEVNVNQEMVSEGIASSYD